MILRSLFEVVVAALLIYGFCHESEIAEWEHKQLIKLKKFKEKEIKE